MATLFDRPTNEVIASLLSAHPDVAMSLEVARQRAWELVDPILLELCRLRIAMLLGCRAEFASRTPAAVAAGLDEASVDVLSRWMTSPLFGPRERACLAFTEQFVVDVAGLDDATAGAVRHELGEQGLVDFVNALLVVEQRQRLHVIWEQLFGDVS